MSNLTFYIMTGCTIAHMALSLIAAIALACHMNMSTTSSVEQPKPAEIIQLTPPKIKSGNPDDKVIVLPEHLILHNNAMRLPNFPNLDRTKKFSYELQTKSTAAQWPANNEDYTMMIEQVPISDPL